LDRHWQHRPRRQPGPFWHHREVGEKGEGVKIEEKSPETFSGTAGTVTLETSISGQKIVVQSSSAEVKGEKCQ
jgi:hypothetical protein